MNVRWRLINLVSASFVCALLIERMVPLRWWQPACSTGDLVPYATGFPLPYSEWTTASSLEYWVSIPALVIDLCILAAPIAILLRLIGGKFSDHRKILKIFAFFTIGVVGALEIFGLFTTSVPITTFAPPGAKFTQYRPRFFEPTTTGPTCEIYD
jgi:hypothetical protein